VPTSFSPSGPTPTEIDALGEAIEAREVVERATVRLAADRRTEDDLQRLRHALAGMVNCIDDPEAFVEHDLALHEAIADAAGNCLLAAALADLRGLVREMIAIFIRSAESETTMHELFAAHADLVDALERRDGDEAARIITSMMVRLRAEAARRGLVEIPKTTANSTPRIAKEMEREDR